MTKGTQKLTYEPGSTKYYTNCRGLNYVPIAYSEWEKSGFAPRVAAEYYSGLIGIASDLNPAYKEVADAIALSKITFHEPSATFRNNNKTAQWWYYSHNDNEKCLKLLRSVGVNTIRVWTNIYVWEKKGQKHIDDFKDFMSLCDKHKMRVQLVFFDGVYGPPGSEVFEPGSLSSTSNQFLSGNPMFNDHVYYALMQDWTRSPYDYQVSSKAAADNFYSNSALPYINEICQNLSSYQSLWSFDIGNETDSKARPFAFSSLYVSSSFALSSNLSSIGIGITFGNGDNFRPWRETLVGGPNNGKVFPGYPTDLTTYSSIYNFATVHPYRGNNRFSAQRDIREVVSGSLLVGKPVMANEINYVYGQYISDVLNWYCKEQNFGVMIWDAFVDLGISNEIFQGFGGVFHWDGEVRRSKDTDAFIDLALHHGWLSKSQLKKAKQKNNSSKLGQLDDTGQDGGYTSATVPIHIGYNPDLHVSCINLLKYNLGINIVYPQTNPPLNALGAFIGGIMGYTPTRPKNYIPWEDQQPFAIKITDLLSTDVSFKEILDRCKNYKKEFRDFSSILVENGIQRYQNVPGLSSGPVYKLLNEQAAKKALLLDVASVNTAVVMAFGPEPYLLGSQYDEYPNTQLRLNFSSNYFDILRQDKRHTEYHPGYDGSTCICWNDSKNNTNASDTPHWVSGTGYYIVPGDKYSGLDWWKYDDLFHKCFDSFNAYIEAFQEKGKIDDRYRLY